MYWYKKVKIVLKFTLNRRRKLRLRLGGGWLGAEKATGNINNFLMEKSQAHLPSWNQQCLLPFTCQWLWTEIGEIKWYLWPQHTDGVSSPAHFIDNTPDGSFLTLKALKVWYFSNSERETCPDWPPYLNQWPPQPTVTLESLSCCIFFQELTTIWNYNVGWLVYCLPPPWDRKLQEGRNSVCLDHW